ncbi:hypothetical protein K493DRAFT_317542 [Basidiobolus meristosporus CBS 931.73]|uniref:P-loop containing nucleoside triphosphate hydrolase protein n=1 Tax=Basidiobolus meristosporus CBS 931.73 TaxID=1314790 RepID=A0A1Y1XZD3_9FUNG|nr:hypothetical protein K493DRAFT_317542 [Basidiobolus meristosporus CBS 931.73]|eukprot:ORX91088.1 hypothetical protein K493DRAFT_317542 [Basidiobolus meristosporus CBS 931.73]
MNKLKKAARTETKSSNGSFDYQPIIDTLKKVYQQKVKPIETTYNFEGFHSAPLTDRDIDAKPIVLLIGQYSTGKTSFIKYLLQKNYPGAHIGVEPTTDRFVAVMNGAEEKVIPGNAAAVSGDLPFGGLQKFGTAFLSRFQVSQSNSPLLEDMTIIDTPGILSGEKQRLDRGYDFSAIIRWFAERADIILLLFDGHKLDISDEFKTAIQVLRGQEEKIRVVLNKCDQVSNQQLMRVYGALMWSLGKVIQSPEVTRVYLGSFWLEKPPNVFEDSRELLLAEQSDLLQDLDDLPKNAAVRKVNEIVKRARIAKVHAYIISHLKKEMPAMFGKDSKQSELIANLDKEFVKIQQKHNLSPGDFPNVEIFKEGLKRYKFADFSKFNQRILDNVDEALSKDFPRLMDQLPQTTTNESSGVPMTPANPFETDSTSQWHFQAIEKEPYLIQFRSCRPVHGKVSGVDAKPAMMNTRLGNDILAKIWRIADWDGDGYLDADQFVVAMHLCNLARSGAEIPDELPATLKPFA